MKRQKHQIEGYNLKNVKIVLSTSFKSTRKKSNYLWLLFEVYD